MSKIFVRFSGLFFPHSEKDTESCILKLQILSQLFRFQIFRTLIKFEADHMTNDA